jgi:hypothetical protein
MLRVQATMRDSYQLDSDHKKESGDQELKPLRYNPGLKCDPELEALRPERQSKHTPLPSGDWKKYLIKTQPSYEGSFADVDIQKFRPNPNPSMMEDPWYVSRLPQGGQACVAVAPSVDPYCAMFPCDQLAQIKMRNRRFQQSCAMEGVQGSRGQVAGPGAAQMMMMQNNQMTEDMVMMNNMAYSDLQRQVNMLQTLPQNPIPPARLNVDDDTLTIDMLPKPRKIVPKPEEVKPALPAQPSSAGASMADTIAIRSYVLGKSL